MDNITPAPIEYDVHDEIADMFNELSGHGGAPYHTFDYLTATLTEGVIEAQKLNPGL